jgi:hypothetical protein
VEGRSNHFQQLTMIFLLAVLAIAGPPQLTILSHLEQTDK